MQYILENVLSGKLATKDLILWLHSNSSEVAELKSVENSAFIIYFINNLKENCSFFLNKTDKARETPTNNLCPKKSSFPNSQTQTLSENELLNTEICPDAPKSDSPFKTDNTTKTNFHKSVAYSLPRESNNKRVQIFGVGCAPYQKQRDKFIKENKSSKNCPAKSDVYSVNDFKKNGETDIHNLEAFPPLGCKPSNLKAQRRITPTPVQSTSLSTSQFGKSQFPQQAYKIQSDAFRMSNFQDKNSDLQQERSLLKQTRNELLKQTSLVNESKSMELKVCKMKPASENYLFPDLKKTSYIKEIAYLVEIYCYILDRALVPNITLELYFLFELLTLKITVDHEPKVKTLFCSIHNCVYFASSVLTQQHNLLLMLDNTTLSTLENIPYLAKFSPGLITLIQQYCKNKQDVATSLPSLSRVPFQLDDDSRANFPDEHSFISFKKQRDLFYELLREFQDQPLRYTDLTYHEKFSKKAKLLITLSPGTLNMYHLAKLFQSQLIASCMSFEVNEVYDETVNDIQKNFPAKFKKLQERFLVPAQVGGLCPLPTFYGIQAFFSELIVAAASPSLNQHLINIFVTKILELNDTDIFSEGELSSLGTLKDKFIFLLHTLRLLGKFLGYVYFLPYKSGQPIPSHLSSSHIKYRKNLPPPIDLPNILKQALCHNHVILTVPWIVEYLSMVDPLAQQLEHIKESLKLLTDVYKWDQIPSKDLYSVLFFRLIIGWLFDVLHYPKQYYMLLKPATFIYSSKNERKGMDSVPLINKKLIHSCCPFLVEFKVLVFNFLNDITNKREARKITPFSTSQAASLPTRKQQTETELEENFFFLHPSSLKKTVDFVAERMTSKTISKIRTNVTNSKFTVVKDIINSNEYKLICSSDDILKKQQDISKLLDSAIQDMYGTILKDLHELIESVCTNIDKLMPLLLSEDVKENVVQVCCQIAFRLAVNKITEWCDLNLIVNAIKTDVEKKVQHVSKGEPVSSCDKNLNVSQWISVARCTVTEIHSKTELGNIKVADILQLCLRMNDLLSKESSIAIKKTIILLSVDLYIALVIKFPDICTGTLNDMFIQLWSKLPKKLLVEDLFLCAQNMTFLLASNHFELSCEIYVNSINSLLEINIFNMENIQNCLHALSDLDWQDRTLVQVLENRIGNFLTNSKNTVENTT